MRGDDRNAFGHSLRSSTACSACCFFSGKLRFGYSILSGALTLSIMILPLIMRTTEEARCSPCRICTGRAALDWARGGCERWCISCCRTAIPGILSGVILAIGRIVGETAALMYTSGTVEESRTDGNRAARWRCTCTAGLWGLYHRAGVATASFCWRWCCSSTSVPRGLRK